MFSIDTVGGRVGGLGSDEGLVQQSPGRSGARPLVARAGELDQVRRVLASAAAGLGRLVVLYGPAGIGRSSLVVAAAELATGRGMQVLTARGSELERGYPFGIARQLLEDHILGLPADERRSVLNDAGPAAPAALGLEPDAGGDDSTGFDRVHALHVTASRLAARRPLLLTVDDVQWCDRPSLDFLCYLGHRASRLPVVVLLSWRRGEPGVRAGRLQALAGRRDTTFLSLRPFDLDAVSTILGDELGTRPSSTLTQTVWERTGGLPFLVRELALAIRARSAPSADPAAASRQPDGAGLVTAITPEPVRRDVAARLARHPEAVRRFAQAVAVLGERCPIARAGQLAELEPERAPAAADALERAGILRHDESVTFAAPLLRDAAYDTLSSVERAQLHSRAARLLAEASGEVDAESVARHLLLGLPAEDRGWQPTLRTAAHRAAARGDDGFALRCLERALIDAAPAQRAEILAELGRIELRVGESPGAENHLREALSLTETETERARLATELEAADAVVKVCAGAAPTPSAALDPARAATPGERALLAASCLAAAQDLRGDAATVVHCCRAVLAVATLGHEPVAAYLAARAALLADGRDLTEATATGRRGPAALALRAQLSLARGDLGLADEQAAAAVETADALGSLPLGHRVCADAVAVRALVAVHRDRSDEALRLLAELSPEDPARAPLRALVTVGGDSKGDEGGRPWAEGLVAPGVAAPAARALAHQRAGRDAPAVELALAHLTAARSWGAPALVAEALLVAAIVGSPDERRTGIEEALAVLAGVDAPLTLARARIELGCVLRRQGHRRNARQELERGADLAHRCGAAALVERARSELVAAGARPRRQAFSGVESLTASERRVAELAAGEMTNRQIAQALTVSMKTVAGQLNAVYRKLDVHDRRALAAALGADSDRPVPTSPLP